jgi:DNA-binding IclR family transcriptional regulator
MKSESKIKPVYRLKSIEKIFDILDCFSFENRELNLTEITRKTGLHKTTAKRLVTNLMARNYLQQDPSTKRYSLGLRLFELGGIVFASFSLRKTASPYMNDLRNKTGATVLLGVRMEKDVVYIDRRGGAGMIYVTSDIGWRRPLHFGMLGIMLMASLDPEETDKILSGSPLEAHTPFSITEKKIFKDRLEDVRNKGYVVESEEAVEGTIGIAAPIRDFSRKVIAALGVVVTSGRRNPKEEIDNIANLVKKACNDISFELGYS